MPIHLFQGQADFPAYVFALVLRRHIHVSGLIVGDLRRSAGFVRGKQIKFLFCSEEKLKAGFFGVLHGLFENSPGVLFKGLSVRPDDIRKHADYPAMLRTPGKEGQRPGLRAQQQIGAGLVPKACHGGGVKGDPIIEGPGKLLGHDGYIFLPAEHIAKAQADELYILLPDILHHFLLRIIHFCPESFLVHFYKQYIPDPGPCQEVMV